MELIEAKTLGSNTASVTFDNIPQTYTDIKLVISARTDRAGQDNDALFITINGVTTNLANILLESTGSGSGSSNTNSGASTKVFPTVGSTATANTFGNGEIYFPNYTGSQYKSFSGYGVTENNATQAITGLSANLWSNTAAITSLTFNSIGTNFVSGSTFYLYGIQSAEIASKATGGITTFDGTYFYHTFLQSGTFTPTTALTADTLVIAGGGGGGRTGGGGGAGGLRALTSQSMTATAYAITIGAGGIGNNTDGQKASNGTNSSIIGTGLSISSTGGGGASSYGGGTGLAGGSGGGGSGGGSYAGGAGNAGSYSPVEGYAGGTGGSDYDKGGGGGGAGAVGNNANSGSGGIGATSALLNAMAIATGTGQSSSGNYYYAGGGGAAQAQAGGLGGGGECGNNAPGIAGTANTGGGGGAGTGNNPPGAQGGSGLVIIRYAI